MDIRSFLSSAGLLFAASTSWAAELPGAVFLAEGGATLHGTYAVTAGVAWRWDWQRPSSVGLWTGATEAFVSHWRARGAGGGREGYTHVGVTPVLRLRFDQGRSPWFMEGGIGLSLFDSLYVTDRKQFSTRFNFYDTVGVGRSFGAARAHEWTLRLTHISNGGIKKPNPGENFIQLRYTRNL